MLPLTHLLAWQHEQLCPRHGTDGTPARGQQMRILFVYANLGHLGGLETQIRRLAQRLNELGHQVTILLQQGLLNHVQDPTASRGEAVRQSCLRPRVVRSAPASLRTVNLGEFDYIYAFETNSLLLGL